MVNLSTGSLGALAIVKGWRFQPFFGFEIDHRELPGHERQWVAQWHERYFGKAVTQIGHGSDLVVVKRKEVAGQNLAIDVEGETDPTDRDIAPPQRR